MSKPYVRCRWCDSAFNVEDIKDSLVFYAIPCVITLRQRADLTCPACGKKNEECQIFKGSNVVVV